MHFYYDREGRPVSNDQWEALFVRERNNRRVAQSGFGVYGWVSTVWLGLNHAYDDGPPLIFETMVFGGPMDEYMERYTTEAQAREGHALICILLATLRAERHQPLIHNGKKPRK